MITSKCTSYYLSFTRMRFFVFIILVLLPTVWSLDPGEKATQTYITLNTQKGCRVRVAAWLSPSCTHCADYFKNDIPKIIDPDKMPGFCLDLHFLPHLYLLDMHVAILIWSQGPQKVMNNAALFFENQSKWLDPSVSRSNLDDPDRQKDIERFIKEISKDQSKNAAEINAYLKPEDPALYIKMFALQTGKFSLEDLKKYLPKDSVNQKLSVELLRDLPRKDDAVVKFSPAFTYPQTGELVSDNNLDRGILTPSEAKKLLDQVPEQFLHQNTQQPQQIPQRPATVPQTAQNTTPQQTLQFPAKPSSAPTQVTHSRTTKKFAKRQKTEIDEEFQDADAINEQPPVKKSATSNTQLSKSTQAPMKKNGPNPYDDDFDLDEYAIDEIDTEDDFMSNDDEISKKNAALEKVLKRTFEKLEEISDGDEIWN